MIKSSSLLAAEGLRKRQAGFKLSSRTSFFFFGRCIWSTHCSFIRQCTLLACIHENVGRILAAGEKRAKRSGKLSCEQKASSVSPTAEQTGRRPKKEKERERKKME